MSEHRDAAAAPLWYSTLDAEGVAHAAAKGWDKLEPAQAALAAAQAARNLEKMHGGITSGEYARLPRADAPDEAKAFFADGEALAALEAKEPYNDGVEGGVTVAWQEDGSLKQVEPAE